MGKKKEVPHISSAFMITLRMAIPTTTALGREDATVAYIYIYYIDYLEDGNYSLPGIISSIRMV